MLKFTSPTVIVVLERGCVNRVYVSDVRMDVITVDMDHPHLTGYEYANLIDVGLPGDVLEVLDNLEEGEE